MKLDSGAVLGLANLAILIVGLGAGGYEWFTFKRTFEQQTLKQLAYANDQLKIAVGVDEQKPVDYNSELTVTQLKKYPDGTALYDVSFDVTNKNMSKSLIHITYSSAELYLGDPSNKELAPGSAVKINDAPDPWHPQDSGLISWHRIAYEADVDDGPTNPAVSKWMQGRQYAPASISHTGLTGTFLSGTSNEYMPEFLIRAKPSQYIDIVVGFGIDDSLDVASPNVGIIDESQILADAVTKNHGEMLAKKVTGVLGGTKPPNRSTTD